MDLNGSASIPASKGSTGVAPEVNLRNPLFAGYAVCKWGGLPWLPWLSNPGQMSREIQNRVTSGPTKRTHVLQKHFKKMTKDGFLVHPQPSLTHLYWICQCQRTLWSIWFCYFLPPTNEVAGRFTGTLSQHAMGQGVVCLWVHWGVCLWVQDIIWKQNRFRIRFRWMWIDL